ncbi:hypothetical protein CK203_102000 [Vitis vinifera]|uniref:Retrovirus-related Pol polyprotein from transposon TNT 1-94-like beta-barrel domain-containing protein n=1 Tax=Vitis vinifera TaxID=29760 RepID=A0A438D8P6_VITVI|nr:hypothetical protein CK203_102000 [Vitis vinifera]
MTKYGMASSQVSSVTAPESGGSSKIPNLGGSGSTIGIAFTANRGGMKPWIVDTGASDHMTGDAAILQNYKPSNGHSSVHIADGSKSKIAGTGSIKLTKDLYLDSVLHVPNLDLLNCVPGSTSSHVANSQTKSLKQVAYSLKGEAILTATYLINRMPSRVLTFQSPRQLLLKKFPHTRAASSDLPLKGESMNEHQVWESLLEAVPFSHSESPNPSQSAPTELSTPMPSSVQPA